VAEGLVVDALSQRLKVRDDLVRVRLVERGEPLYMYKVVETQDYYRLSEIQHEILVLFDGIRTLEEVVEAFNVAHPELPIDLDFLQTYVDTLRATEIFEKSREEKKRLLLETIRDQRRRRVADGGPLGNLLELKLSAWDPDRTFTRLAPRLRFFWTRGFVILSAACMLVMLAIWSAHWERIKSGTLALFSFEGKTGSDLLQFFLILLVIGFCHESAHGLTCKHFGGHVNHMGFLLIYFTPCFFVDLSDAYLFDSHFKRQWVIYAGGYIEVFICSLATFVWSLTSPGTLVSDVSYKVLLLTGLSSVIINYNPLIKLDGYYSLMDFMELPDLWERSFAYVSGWIKRTIFRLPVELEIPAKKIRRILVGYCLASLAYKVLLIGVVMIFLKNILVSLFGNFGYVGLVVLLVVVLRRYLFKLVTFVKFNLLDKKEVLMKTRSLVVAGTGGAVLAAAVTFLPLPIVIRGDCVLESRSKAFARSSVEGTIERVLVKEGQEVRQGQELAALRNDPLTRRLGIAQRRLELVEREIEEAAGRQNPALLAKKMKERDLLRTEVRVVQDRGDALTLRAPITGVVLTSRLDDLVGAYLEAGQPFCEVAMPEGLLARVPVREARTDEILPGQPVELKLVSFPFRTISGRVMALAPASGQATAPGPDPGHEFTDFEAIVAIPGQPAGLKDGMAGSVRIHVGHSTLARRALRAFRRWIASRIW
jgi:putative peptide zinc metalloprotease protein